MDARSDARLCYKKVDSALHPGQPGIRADRVAWPGCQAGGEREQGIGRQDKLLGVSNAWDAKVCQKEQRHVKVSKVCKIREKIV